MILLLQVHLSREEGLLAIIRLFHGETDGVSSAGEQKKQSTSNIACHLCVDKHSAFRESLLLKGIPDLSLPSQFPLLSLTRNQGCIRVHALLRLLVAFHLPAVFAHLEKVDGNWWYPCCYEIENELDFVTVGTVEWLFAMCMLDNEAR